MKIKNFYKLVYLILCIPALVVHELSHIIVLYLTLNRIDGFKIKKIGEYAYNFIINRYIAKYKFFEYLICLSPLIILISLYILCIYLIINSLYIFPIIFIPYSLICIKTFLPSNYDYNAMRNWKSREQIFFEALNS